MKKIFIVFMVILLLGLTIFPSFADYQASFEVEDNDVDFSDSYINFQSSNLLAYSSYDLVNYNDRLDCTYEDSVLHVVPLVSSVDTLYSILFYDVPLDIGTYTFSFSYKNLGSSTSYIYGNSIYNVSIYDSANSLTILCPLLFTFVANTSDYTLLTWTFDISVSSSYTVRFGCDVPNLSSNYPVDLYFTEFMINKGSSTTAYTEPVSYSLLLSDYIDVQSSLSVPLDNIYFTSNDHNRGVYLQAFSDSDLTTDITSDVATSSGLTLDSDGLIYLDFVDGETDQLYYDGTVYYQVTLDPSPPYMFVNLYRHIFENFAGTYTFLTEDNWIFITCVSSIAICFVIFVGVFFFKRFSH